MKLIHHQLIYLFYQNIPILGLCYGAQLIAKIYGEIVRSKNREYGRAKLNFISDNSVLMMV